MVVVVWRYCNSRTGYSSFRTGRRRNEHELSIQAGRRSKCPREQASQFEQELVVRSRGMSQKSETIRTAGSSDCRLQVLAGTVPTRSACSAVRLPNSPHRHRRTAARHRLQATPRSDCPRKLRKRRGVDAISLGDHERVGRVDAGHFRYRGSIRRWSNRETSARLRTEWSEARRAYWERTPELETDTSWFATPGVTAEW